MVEENLFIISIFLLLMTTIRISNNIPSRPMELDANALSSCNPQLQRRMDRIADHYRQLDSKFIEIEAKIQSDERLKAIDATIQEVELTVDGRRRRWRPRRPKTEKTSAPRKPR
jgi:hypothetical protein